MSYIVEKLLEAAIQAWPVDPANGTVPVWMQDQETPLWVPPKDAARDVVAAVIRELADEKADAEADDNDWPDSGDLAMIADEIEAVR